MAKKTKKQTAEPIPAELSVHAQDLSGRYGIVRLSWFNTDHVKAFTRPEMRVFFMGGGFGCSPKAMGRSVMGFFLFDKEECRVVRGNIERFATRDETTYCIDLNALSSALPLRDFALCSGPQELQKETLNVFARVVCGSFATLKEATAAAQMETHIAPRIYKRVSGRWYHCG